MNAHRWGWRVMIVAGVALVIFRIDWAEARSHVEGRVGVPAMVARVLPSVVSITTRQIERDHFNQPAPTRGLGSGFVIARRGYVLAHNHVSALGRSMEQPGLPTLHNNLRGQVVGINTAVIASAHGIGFAISVGMAKSAARQMRRGREGGMH